MGTAATAEQIATPEKKMRRADTAPLVENETKPPNEMAATSRPLEYVSMTKCQKSNWRKRNK